jgi:hypothetical protein
MVLGALVAAHITLAQIFYLVAIIATGLWLFGSLAKREEAYWSGALPIALLFIALGLLFSI